MQCKYALLDTDFISKTYAIQGRNQEPLINKVMCLPGSTRLLASVSIAGGFYSAIIGMRYRDRNWIQSG